MSLTLTRIEAFLAARRKRKKHARPERATAAPGELRDVKIPRRGE